MGIVKICAIIQSTPLEHGEIVFLTDNRGRHRLNGGKVGMIERGREGKAVNVLCVLQQLRLCDGKLG